MTPATLSDLAREVLSRPHGIARCCLCGCEMIAPDATGLAHPECTDAELWAVRFDEPSPFAADLDPHPSTGFGSDDDFTQWVSELDTAFGDKDVGF